MLRVTRLTDYATVVLTALAQAPDRVLSAAELAEHAHLELPTVSKVLKPLAHAGLVESFRGASGGYRLARPATAISLIEVVEAIEGPLGMTDCSGDHNHCEHEPHCGVQTHWRRVNDVIATALRDVSLADMLPQPTDGQVPQAGATGVLPPAPLAHPDASQDAQEGPTARPRKPIPHQLASA